MSPNVTSYTEINREPFQRYLHDNGFARTSKDKALYPNGIDTHEWQYTNKKLKMSGSFASVLPWPRSMASFYNAAVSSEVVSLQVSLWWLKTEQTRVGHLGNVVGLQLTKKASVEICRYVGRIVRICSKLSNSKLLQLCYTLITNQRRKAWYVANSRSEQS